MTSLNDAIVTSPPSTTAQRPATIWPGLLLAAAGGAAGLLGHRLVPQLSPVLVAIVLGVVVGNLRQPSAATAPGLAVASRRVLRIGVALLGLQLVLSDVFALGWAMVLVIVAVVVGGIAGSLCLGRALGVPPGRRLLIACGFSICGAAAVAAVAGVRRSEERDVASAVALVVAFGSTAMLVLPAIATALGMNVVGAGAWAGGSIHEVGQVVVAGGLLGGAALQVAVVVKLGRVLMLAPVLTALTWADRRRGAEVEGAVRPPLMPAFVAVFILGTVARTWLPLPDQLLDVAGVVQSLALAAAMFALGHALDRKCLSALRGREVAMAAGASVLVALIALPAVFLVS
ncbi:MULTISPECIES: YeiH family protein [unclassified Nocardioides]|uniref:YeiH family protein n=1 Tax=unclassified Nocardioides TaxID=2615069 RepID=UPI0006FAD87C|nr:MULTISPECIES: putative sulfate exporter family transporter [unclassified Nocardioides]KQY57024.1 hypothetical protein ASD30_12230 [Nocardioides sp. Root140]KRF13148.1 hypothetical protein ASH02_16875 [Nocardioides sp. Soil796]